MIRRTPTSGVEVEAGTAVVLIGAETTVVIGDGAADVVGSMRPPVTVGIA
jgi:hypothetical protein